MTKVSVEGIEQLASDLLPSRQFGHLVLPGAQDHDGAVLAYELWSKLLKGGYIGDYIGYYYRGY